MATSARRPSTPVRDNRYHGMFRKAYASRRCLVLADGYFEWQKLAYLGKRKLPYAIAMKDDRALRHGRHLGRVFRQAQGRTYPHLRNCDLRAVILASEDYMRWLGPEPD